jgi:hypothetical protein
VRTLLILVGVTASLLPLHQAKSQVPTRIPKFSLTLVSDPGDFILQGATWVFANGDRRDSKLLRYDKGRESVKLSFGGGTQGGWLQFAAPPGRKLNPNFYDDAQRTAFRAAGHPGIDVSTGSRACSQISGWFDIKVIRFGSDGSIRRLWMTFEQHCEGALSALYGELRIGRGSHSSDAAVLPDRPSWPDVEVGAKSWELPVYVVPLRRGVEVASVVRRGSHRDDFMILENSCPGRTLRRGVGCGLVLTFAPQRGGPRSSKLIVREGDRSHHVVLEGMAVPGTSRLTMDSEPGDYVGQGKSWQFSALAGDLFWSWTISDFGVETWIDTTEGTAWFLDFGAPGGLQQGAHYADAKRYGFSDGAPGMGVSGEHRGCSRVTGNFTVNQLGFRPNGLRHYYSITFEQHCEGREAALTGTIDYRAPIGETDPPAPVSAVRIQREGGRATVRWSPSTDLDFSYYIVRYRVGGRAPGGPLGGYRGGVSREESVTLRYLPRSRKVSVSVFTVDEAGNIGGPTRETSSP